MAFSNEDKKELHITVCPILKSLFLQSALLHLKSLSPGTASPHAPGLSWECNALGENLAVLEKLEKQGIRVKISDVSDALSLPRPGVTRTVKDMEAKGYVKKLARGQNKSFRRLAMMWCFTGGRGCVAGCG